MGYMRVLIAGVIWLAFTQVSAAEGLETLPYTNLQVSYGKIEVDFDDATPDFDADEVSATAVYDVGHNVYVSGSYTFTETDDITISGVRGSLKNSEFRVGLGYHHALTPTVDLVPSVSWGDATTKAQGGFSGIPDEDYTGWSTGLALRALVTPHIELAGGFNYDNLYDDDDKYVHVEAHYYPINRLSLGVGYVYDLEDGDKQTILRFIAKVFFGQ